MHPMILGLQAAIARRGVIHYFGAMSFLGRMGPFLLAAMLLSFAGGCSPADSNQEDEEKEPHFVLGNDKFNEMDYQAAVDAFRDALEVNPRSAEAHYRLAQLFDTKLPDPAAAIYHYQEYLRLDPQAENPDIIRQRISTCKQQLAADVLPLPSAPATMKQLEDLTENNRQLQQKVDDLTDKLKQWNVYYNSQLAAAKNNPTPAPNAVAAEVPAQSVSQTPEDMTVPVNPVPAKISGTPRPPRGHTHVVSGGETMASIARKCGVSLSALEAANPGVSPKKIRVGQSLNLPP